MRRIYSSAFTGALMLAGMAGGANALTFNEVSVWDSGSPNAPVIAPLFTTAVFTGTYIPSTSGSSDGVQRSPYQDNGNPLASNGLYSVLSPGGDGGSSATYNLTGVTSLTILWGSPDDYNHVKFLDASNTPVSFTNLGVGSDLNGSELGCYAADTCNRLHWALVNFSWDPSSAITKLVLGDDGTAAFEFAMQQPERETNPTPLPGAVWLFGTVLAGSAGFKRWRNRKTKNASLATAAA